MRKEKKRNERQKRDEKNEEECWCRLEFHRINLTTNTNIEEYT